LKGLLHQRSIALKISIGSFIPITCPRAPD
jgi:hypothetical protein